MQNLVSLKVLGFLFMEFCEPLESWLVSLPPAGRNVSVHRKQSHNKGWEELNYFFTLLTSPQGEQPGPHMLPHHDAQPQVRLKATMPPGRGLKPLAL